MQFAATLPASDVERAKAWYASVLQLEPVEITEDGSAWYETGGTRFLLYFSRFAGTNQATAAAVGVDDVEATVAELKSRGAVFEDYDFGEEFRTVDGILTTPDGRKMAWLKDSEGNILGIATP
ncbi:MAG: VOC family protein [Chloroflexota bacterium]|jgi:predicted enzyme related to lactoylglutathione lyase